MSTDNLHQLRDKSKAELHKLDASLALQKLFPDCYDHGKCSIQWYATNHGKISGGKLTRGDGSVIPLTAEHADLLGVTVDQLKRKA